MSILETQRLILRRWRDSDAEDLYRYASDPDVGPVAGWPPHRNIDESRDVIKDVFDGPEAYAICLKEDGNAIGAIELKLNGHTKSKRVQKKCGFKYQRRASYNVCSAKIMLCIMQLTKGGMIAQCFRQFLLPFN